MYTVGKGIAPESDEAVEPLSFIISRLYGLLVCEARYWRFKRIVGDILRGTILEPGS
jgi:hypothetical protein